MQRDHNARDGGRPDRNKCHDSTSTVVLSEHEQHNAGDDRNDFSRRDNTGRRYSANERQREWRKRRECARLRQFDGGSAVFTG